VPSVGQFPTGVTLLVTPVVSADRRYVRMTLAPFFTALNNFTTIQVPAAVGGSGLGGGAATINGTIQLPNFTQTSVVTTVTVPDGGTVLLGGVKRLQEQRLEYGVPVLSKTPWIDRLFRNVGIGRQTSSLMLMVTPRIIILEEEEERLGIPAVAF
jgi:type II secretory pathway component GspD/PulD (secretin)